MYFRPEELRAAENEFFLVSLKASDRLHGQLHNLMQLLTARKCPEKSGSIEKTGKNSAYRAVKS